MGWREMQQQQLAAIPNKRPTAKTIPSTSGRVSLQCIHLGPAITKCKGIYQCKNPKVESDRCIVRGKPSVYGIPRCEECEYKELPYTRLATTPAPRRHLIYYLYPVTGNGTWQRNIDQLKQRISLFNGERFIMVATAGDHELDDIDTVREYIADASIKLLPRKPGRKGLHEATYFIELLHRVKQHLGNKDYTFYGHAKGVTRPVGDGVSVHRWTTLMYKACLDEWSQVEGSLATHPITGPFKTKSYFVPWHYSGTFFWFRNRDVFSRNWRYVRNLYGGVEMWPPGLFSEQEAGCLFYGGEGYSLYSVEEIARAEACYERRPWENRDASGDAQEP